MNSLFYIEVQKSREIDFFNILKNIFPTNLTIRRGEIKLNINIIYLLSPYLNIIQKKIHQLIEIFF